MEITEKQDTAIDIPKSAWSLINKRFNGHYTLMKFTTNYRFCFGTLFPDDYLKWRSMITKMSEGRTAREAMIKESELLFKIGQDNYYKRYDI
jgi:hypothetical protein